MGKGSSSQPTEQQVTTTTSNLPEYAQPYYERMMNSATGLLGQEYTPYPGERVSGFTPEQQYMQQQVMGLQQPGQFDAATNFMGTAGLGALALGNSYQPYAPSYDVVGQPNLNYFSMGQPADVQAGVYNAPQMSQPGDVQGGTYTGVRMGATGDIAAPIYDTPQSRSVGNISATMAPGASMNASQMGNIGGISALWAQSPFAGPIGDVDGSGLNITAPTITAAQTGYNPQLTAFQMADPSMFGQAQADQYMSPYMQNVVDVTKREAILDAKKTQLAEDLGAARQGAYGGSRELIAALERERNLGQNLSDIQSRGLQSAYENAQQQFERDRQAGLYTGTQNLQSKLGVQQLGTQTGLSTALANLDARQQANVLNAANSLQAQGMSADNALRAALANQSTSLGLAGLNVNAALQTNLTNVGNSLKAAMANQSTDLTSAMANLDARQQAAVQNLAAELQTQGLNADQALRAALANQQAGLQLSAQDLGAALQTNQLNAGNQMQAALANQQTGLTTNIQQMAADLQAQGLTADQAMRAALANQQMAFNTGQQNLASQLQTQGINADQYLRSQLANQQMGFNTGQQNLQSYLQTQQLGGDLGLRAALANQQSGLDAQRMYEASRQFGGNLGMTGYDTLMRSGTGLGALGAQQQTTDLQRLQAMGAVGDQTQALQQAQMDQQYADFLRQRDYPMEMLSYYNSMLRGLPLGINSTQTTYAPPPSMASQVLGTGLGGLSMYKMLAGG